MLTFLLMFVIIHVTEGLKEKGLMAGIAIGVTVGLEAILAFAHHRCVYESSQVFCSGDGFGTLGLFRDLFDGTIAGSNACYYELLCYEKNKLLPVGK